MYFKEKNLFIFVLNIHSNNKKILLLIIFNSPDICEVLSNGAFTKITMSATTMSIIFHMTVMLNLVTEVAQEPSIIA